MGIWQRLRGTDSPAAPDAWQLVRDLSADLKADLMGRFDRTDGRLDELHSRLARTATQDQVSQVHRRVDGIDGRLKPLEAKEAIREAVEADRNTRRTVAKWVIGLVAPTIAGATVTTLLALLHH